ncbi:hypothetical protein [Victivallis vadensis]|uniref:hypothetical protein n=1 Tax=Victivallis vadensis TaxID=172901 RepID=UPI0023F1C047|nr:hypothetical protein [Victivallis vadensis]
MPLAAQVETGFRIPSGKSAHGRNLHFLTLRVPAGKRGIGRDRTGISGVGRNRQHHVVADFNAAEMVVEVWIFRIVRRNAAQRGGERRIGRAHRIERRADRVFLVIEIGIGNETRLRRHMRQRRAVPQPCRTFRVAPRLVDMIRGAVPLRQRREPVRHREVVHTGSQLDIGIQHVADQVELLFAQPVRPLAVILRQLSPPEQADRECVVVEAVEPARMDARRHRLPVFRIRLLRQRTQFLRIAGEQHLHPVAVQAEQPAAGSIQLQIGSG